MKGDPNKRFEVLFELVPEPAKVRVKPKPEPEPEPDPPPETLHRPWYEPDPESLSIEGSLLISGTGIEQPSQDFTVMAEEGEISLQALRVVIHNAQSILTLPSLWIIPAGTAVTLDGTGNAVACFSTFDLDYNQPIGICVAHDGAEVTIVTQGTLEIEGSAFLAGQPVYIDDVGELSHTPPSNPGTYVAQVGMALSTEMVLVNLPVTFITRNA